MNLRHPRAILLLVLAILLLVLAIGAVLRPDPQPVADAAPPPVRFDPPAWQVAAGRRLYRSPGAELGCVSCHGPNGGGSRLGPSLLGLVDEYSSRLGRDHARVFERLILHMKDPDAFPALRPDRGSYLGHMPPYSGLSREDLEALAAYVMSLTTE